MLVEEGEEWSFNEGCLEYSDVREDVYRNKKNYNYTTMKISIRKPEVYDGLIARVINMNTIILKNFIY
jgi:peptide deformylase